MRRQAVSEILSAIIIVSVMSVAAAMLTYVFTERGADMQYRHEDMAKAGMMRAAELIDVSLVECSSTANSTRFLMHNYAKVGDPIALDEFKMYRINMTGDIDRTELGVTFTTLDGSGLGTRTVFNPGETLNVSITDAGCSSRILMVTPAGEFVEITR